MRRGTGEDKRAYPHHRPWNDSDQRGVGATLTAHHGKGFATSGLTVPMQAQPITSDRCVKLRVRVRVHVLVRAYVLGVGDYANIVPLKP